jgi:hypothetical protein
MPRRGHGVTPLDAAMGIQILHKHSQALASSSHLRSHGNQERVEETFFKIIFVFLYPFSSYTWFIIVIGRSRSRLHLFHVSFVSIPVAVILLYQSLLGIVNCNAALRSRFEAFLSCHGAKESSSGLGYGGRLLS